MVGTLYVASADSRICGAQEAQDCTRGSGLDGIRTSLAVWFMRPSLILASDGFEPVLADKPDD